MIVQFTKENQSFFRLPIDSKRYGFVEWRSSFSSS